MERGDDPTASWSTQRLTQLLVTVSALTDRDDVVRTVAEQAAESLESEVGAVVLHGEVVTCLGFGAGSAPDAALTAVRTGDHLDVPGAGSCGVLAAAVPGRGDSRLLVARSGCSWTQGERGLLRAMAEVLGLSLGAGEVLAELHERQALLERLARIQRAVSTRKPLAEVLDSIVAGAAELLGEDVVALRLRDPDDDEMMVTVSSTGVPAGLVSESRRIPLDVSLGGQAIREDRLVVAEAYGDAAHHLRGFVGDGVRAAMACPVRSGDVVVGSLTIATRRRDRTYSASEQEALVALAEHAGLALNDARTVEALREAVADATHQALHDSLTGLPNRALFLDRLSQALVRARRGTTGFAVLFVDLDDFKTVNDGRGHLVGDRLLTEAGERVVAVVREGDTVARLGGDEFAVLLEDVGPEDAADTAVRVLGALAAPFSLADGHVVHVGASIGLLSGTGAEGTAEEVLRDADVAMYRAKEDGKGRVVPFEPGMRQRLQARTALEADLRRPAALDEMVLHYQPVVDLARRRVVGVEALLRWQHPERGLVAPGAFVPLAESTGLIVALGATALRRACTEMARTGLVVSVNLSARQLHEPDLAGVVAGALAASGLPPGRLVLEITESLLVQEGEASTERLHALKDLGVRLAVDDFGTGWSSLAYLSRLPVDALKIDRSFVAGLSAEGSAGRLAGAVVALAQSLELATVAEGVETADQADALRALGADVVQGFAYSPAVPLAELPDAVARIEAQLHGRVPAPRRATAAV